MSGCRRSLGSVWPDDIYVKVASGQLIEPGDVSSIFPTMVGWKVRVMRGGAPLWLGNPGDGSMYYDYTAITAEATWSLAAADGDFFIIQAYKPAS